MSCYFYTFSYVYTRYLDYGDMKKSSEKVLKHVSNEYPGDMSLPFSVMTEKDLNRRAEAYSAKLATSRMDTPGKNDSIQIV